MSVDDAAADSAWNKGVDFAITAMANYLGVPVDAFSWDAATETVDGDVSAVIGNLLRARYGDDFDPARDFPPVPVAIGGAR